MTDQDLFRTHHWTSTLPTEPAMSPEWGGFDRRRSFRVGLGEGLAGRLAGPEEIVPCSLREVSFGGGMLQVGRKLRSDRYVLHLDYQGLQTSLPVRVYQNALHELFYDAGVESRVSFRARIVCCDASIEGLNMLYRIMRDYWCPESVPVR